MLDFIVQRRAALLLLALLAGMLALMNRGIRQAGESTIIDRAVAGVTEPIVKGGTGAAGRIAQRWESLAEMRGALERARRLDGELQRLRAEKLRWEQERRENERLRQVLGLRQVLAGPTIAARVAAASPLAERTVLIDRGLRDGVRAGLAVVAPAGVIGKVIQATASLSKVLLVTDPASGVAVVQVDGAYQGVMVGRGSGMCELLYLPSHAKVVPGDLLLTSGLDQLYPAGIPAGRVVAAGRTPDGGLDIVVRPEASPTAATELMVVLSGGRQEMAP